MFPIAKNGNKLIKQFNQPSLLSFSSLYKKEDWNTARFRTVCVDWYIFINSILIIRISPIYSYSAEKETTGIIIFLIL